MTAASRPTPLAAADEALLDALAARLAAVDAELPRLTAWRPGRAEAGQLHVVRGRTRSTAALPWPERGPKRGRAGAGSLLAAAGVALALLATLRLASFDPRDAGIAPPDLGASASSRASPSATPESPPSAPPSVQPRPSLVRPAATAPPGLDGVVTPVDQAVARALLAKLGARCGVLIVVALPPLEPGVVRKLATTMQLQSFLPDGFGPGWIGTDPSGAARALKGRLLSTEPDGTLWVVRADGAASIVQMRATPVGDGATIWQSADYLWPIDCPAPGTDAKVLITGRGESEWPAGRVVDLRVIWPSAIGARRVAPQ